MASAELREELTCSVCLSIYTDPVSLTCGHCFCHACIGRVLDTQLESTGVYSCPECREEYAMRPSLEKNRKLCNIARQFSISSSPPEGSGVSCAYCVHAPIPAAKTCLQCETSLCDHHLSIHNSAVDHVLTDPTDSLDGRRCEIHRKPLEYHCCKDDVCVCVSCFAVGSHREHRVETLNEAMTKKKERLRKVLEKLAVKSEDVAKKINNLMEVKRIEQEKVTDIRQKCNILFEDARKQMEKMEVQILNLISEQEERISSHILGMIRDLETEKDLLSNSMRHVEELCAMDDPLVVLQDKEADSKDFGGSKNLQKVTKAENNPKIGLNQGLILVSLHAALSDFTTKVKEAVYVPQAIDLSLDVNTATNNVLVSGDLKSASWVDGQLSRPVNINRFVSYCQVLGMESFFGGQHYWEVDASESQYWTVGLAYSSIAREGQESKIGYNRKSWCLNRSANGWLVMHDSLMTRLTVKSPVKKLGVYLDYEGGHLSFYRLCDPIRHLHTFTTTFTEPLHPAFVLWKEGWIRIRS